MTVRFGDLGAESELCLTHKLFPNKEAPKLHSQSWNACLATLARIL